jgi:hypothetical protein
MAVNCVLDLDVPVDAPDQNPGFAAALSKEGFSLVACATGTTLLSKGSGARLTQVQEVLT